jgi:hypothetical protein
MKLSEVILAYQGLKEKVFLHIQPHIDTQVGKLSDDQLKEPSKSSPYDHIRRQITIEMSMRYAPDYMKLDLLEQLETQSDITKGRVPLPNLSPVAAQGILSAIRDKTLHPAWDSFAEYYGNIILTARKGG